MLSTKTPIKNGIKEKEQVFHQMITLINSKKTWAIDAIMKIAKIQRLFTEDLKESATLGTKAKQDINMLYHANKRFLDSVKGEMQTAQEKEMFEQEIGRADVTNLFEVIQSMLQMSNEEKQVVEMIATGIANKRLKVEVLDGGKAFSIDDAKILRA